MNNYACMNMNQYDTFLPTYATGRYHPLQLTTLQSKNDCFKMFFRRTVVKWNSLLSDVPGITDADELVRALCNKYTNV